MKKSAETKMYLLPPQLFLVCCIGMLMLRIYYPVIIWLSLPYNLIGLMLIGLGLILSIWGSRTFSKNQTNIHTFKEPDKLIVEGLYKYSRNPMYLGFLVSLAGIFILLGAVSPILLLFTFLIIVNRWYIKSEEKNMTAKFGRDYLQYKDSTRRWI
ncbi:isoprenylcysteine carboxylmethyltransferase family protein [Paenibacillus sp. SI8]|uniref:methyltransferase family protein n=1 Tax=unclassified Paenibacillus TaxID=185978 RepID=UPI0034662EAC